MVRARRGSTRPSPSSIAALARTGSPRSSQQRPASALTSAVAHQTALTLGSGNDSYAIVRYFSVYGEPQVVKENSHSWAVAWFTMRAALGLPLHLNGGGMQVRDFVHVDDIADATLTHRPEHRYLAQVLVQQPGRRRVHRGLRRLPRCRPRP